jgi:hypothetical protein
MRVGVWRAANTAREGKCGNDEVLSSIQSLIDRAGAVLSRVHSVLGAVGMGRR